MMRPQVIGLTGPNSSGKGEAAAYLAQAHGYAVHSLSDVLREEARRRGQEPVRAVLIPLGNELRRTHGAGVLAERTVPRLVPPAVVDSIRNPQEVEVLRRVPGFVLFAVRARVETRFARSVGRARSGDPRTLPEFVAREDEENTADPSAQQLDATAALADVVVDNDGSLDDLHAALDALVAGRAGG